MKFDVIVGNPPYQNGSGNKGSNNTLWDKFVKKSSRNGRYRKEKVSGKIDLA